MNAMGKLMLRDLRRATSNVMATIVVAGLVLIPSLFTWFNVIAGWDPFANTRGLKVAVASTDDGYQSDLVPLRVNVGDQVLSALRANHDLDWVITNEEDAIDGTKSGEYYAAIVLPASFSADMLTFYEPGTKRTELAYYINEKKNALAPKITDQGAEGVSNQISEAFTTALGDVSLGLLSSLSDFLTDADTQATLTRLEARVGTLADQLRAGAGTADMFSTVAQAGIPLVDSAHALVAASGAAFDDAKGAVGTGVAGIDALQSTLSVATSSLADALTKTEQSYDAVGARIDELFAQVDATAESQAATLRTLADAAKQQGDAYTTLRDRLQDEVRPLLPEAAAVAVDAVITRLDEAIARQVDAHDRLLAAAQTTTSSAADAAANRQAAKDALAAARAAVSNAKASYSDDLKPRLDALSETLTGIRSDVGSIGADLNAAAARLGGADDTVRGALDAAQTSTASIAETLRTSADKFTALQRALATAADTGDLTSLQDIIGSDPSTLAAALAAPVRLDRQAVYPISHFGVGMAPLYVVLALWVGALLLTVTIRVDVPEDAVPGAGDLSPTQKYLGRYAVFGVVGLLQSTLVMTGLILFVHIEPAHPFLLVLAGWLISTVFTAIMYTFVVSFGNAGKALAVVLLVIQISGSGGAYPLQLLPQWFQNISPWLPATHAIAAMRAAIAGIYEGDYWRSMGMLALFLVPTLLLGLVLRRPLISFTRGLSEALESTKLM